MQLDTNCPNCLSDHTISVSTAIAEITASAKGRKVGKTEFAFIKQYAFNKHPTSGCIIAIPMLFAVLLLICGIVFVVLDKDVIFTIPSFIIGVGLGVFGLWLMRGNAHLEEQKAEHIHRLKKLWICRDCGHEWTPE